MIDFCLFLLILLDHVGILSFIMTWDTSSVTACSLWMESVEVCLFQCLKWYFLRFAHYLGTPDLAYRIFFDPIIHSARSLCIFLHNRLPLLYVVVLSCAIFPNFSHILGLLKNGHCLLGKRLKVILIIIFAASLFANLIILWMFNYCQVFCESFTVTLIHLFCYFYY